MDFDKCVIERRSIRLFQQKFVPKNILIKLIDLARLAPSGGNRQKLRFVVVQEKQLADEIFHETAWAKLVYPKRTPEIGVSAPQNWIAVIAPKEMQNESLLYAEAGAVIQNILLGATDNNLGSCWIGSFNHAKVDELLAVNGFFTLYLIAIGYPCEKPVLENSNDNANTAYYLDSKNVLHVPKLSVEKLMVWK